MLSLNLDASPYHFPATSLRDGRTKIIASRAKPSSCVLFVHGFGGDALETWHGFDSEALKSPELTNTDLVFFGYDGVRSNALASSSFLFELMSELLTGPDKWLQAVREKTEPYKRCVIVAHSLGAVVSRWTLLRAYHEECPWIKNIRYLLFAPAHSGGIVVDSVSELLSASVITKTLGNIAKVGVPLLKELAPGSPVLKSLEDQTRAAVEKGCVTLRANRVVIAEYEDIVSNLPFARDPYPTAVRDTKHTSVCKPAECRDAIKYVTELLA